MFISPFSEKVSFKFNHEKVIPNQTTLSLVEEFVRPVNSSVVGIKSVEMPFSCPQYHTKGKVTFFFPVIEAICECKIAKVTFILLTAFKLENVDTKILNTTLVSFMLNFSKELSVEIVKFPFKIFNI